MCVIRIVWRQARDCWLAVAENRACNSAKEGVLSDHLQAAFSCQGIIVGFCCSVWGTRASLLAWERQKVLTLLVVTKAILFSGNALLGE